MKVAIVDPLTAAAAAKSLQSCPTLCDPIDGSPRHETLIMTKKVRWRLCSEEA